METGKVTGVSRTAVGVAWLRAQESNRPDRLFHDPYALAFVAGAREVLEAAAEARRSDRTAKVGALFGQHVVIRTRFYDDYLLAAAAAGCQQVVLLAAGLDTRAFRLDWPPGVRLFELDLPAILDYKEHVLTGHGAVPRCERSVLRVDLREDWPARLVEAGFDPTRPTAWLIEGLLIYLSREEVVALLTAVGGLSAPGSQISCEHRDNQNHSLVAMARATPEMNDVTAMWKGGLGESVGGWLDRNGWQAQPHDGAVLAEAYGRTDDDTTHVSFLTAVRDETAAGTS